MHTFARHALALAATLGIALGAVVGPGSVALADTSENIQARLDEARQNRDRLYDEAADVSEQLNTTRVYLERIQADIDATNGKIDETEQSIQEKELELSERRERLSDQVVRDYKAGGLGFLDIILNSKSIEEFVSHVYYADKVSEQQADTIHQTVQLQEELEQEQAVLEQQEQELQQQKSEQEELAATQEAQQADLESKARLADDYVNGLDQELREALAAEEAARRAEAERAAREAAAALQAQTESYYTGTTENSGGTSGGGNSNGGSSSGGSSGGGTTHVTTGGGGLTAAQRETIVNAALSMVGGNYVYGACDPGSRTFDCSGLAMWCYSQAGIDIPHSSDAQQAMTDLRSFDSLLPGDLVFYPGHVAIYYGDGMVIDASSPSVGIIGPYVKTWRTPTGGGAPS